MCGACGGLRVLWCMACTQASTRVCERALCVCLSAILCEKGWSVHNLSPTSAKVSLLVLRRTEGAVKSTGGGGGYSTGEKSG